MGTEEPHKNDRRDDAHEHEDAAPQGRDATGRPPPSRDDQGRSEADSPPPKGPDDRSGGPHDARGPHPEQRGGRRIEQRSFRRDVRGGRPPPGPRGQRADRQDDRRREEGGYRPEHRGAAGGRSQGSQGGPGQGGPGRGGQGGPGQGRPPDRFRPSAGGGRPRGRAPFPPGRPDRRPPGAWQRPDRQTPPPPRRGPSPAELLGEGEEVVAGRRPVEEAFAARRPALRLLVVPARRDALDQLVLHATTLRIPVVEVEGGTLTSVSGFDGHQGVALVVEPRRWATLDDVLAAARAAAEPAFILVLDHLEDPQNVGTLLRSAEACGVHGVLFPTSGSAPFSAAAVKASAGAVEHMRLVPTTDLAGALVDLHGRGIRIVGADGAAPLTVREADLRGPVAIVVGSEGRGIGSKVRRRVDLMARIPMRGRVSSLNASVAGSIFLFEAATQRGLPDAAPAPDDPAEGLAAGPEPTVEDALSQAPGHGSADDTSLDTADRAETASPSPARAADRAGSPDDMSDALLPEAPRDDVTERPPSAGVDGPAGPSEQPA